MLKDLERPQIQSKVHCQLGMLRIKESSHQITYHVPRNLSEDLL